MTDELQQPPKRGRGRPPGTGHPKQLSPKQADFVAAYLKSGNAIQAARETGYSPTYAGSLILVPAVATAIDAARKAVATRAEYNLETAMGELAEGIAFAKTTENATAYVRAVELRAKLAGLMIERIDQRQVGGFTIRISGVDDEAPAAAAPTYAEIFNE